MARTLLRICQDVAGELGTSVPASVIANEDSTASRLKVLINRAAEGIVLDDHNWNVLERMHTFLTVVDQAEYDLPADFGRPCHRTHWNRTTRWRINGPLTPEQYAYLQARPFATALHQRFRVLRSSTGNVRKFLLDPVPTASDQTVAFQYYSNGGIQSAAGAVQEEMLADTDTCIINERLLSLSLRWRYAAALQRASAGFVAEYERALDIAKADDLGGQRLRTGLDDRPRPVGVEGVILNVPWDDMTGATWESWGVGGP